MRFHKIAATFYAWLPDKGSRALRRLAAFVLSILATASASAATVTTPTFEALNAAIQTEQSIRLDFDGTIEFPQPITISKPVELDATGRSVIFDGRQQNQLFLVTATGDLTLRNLTLQNGLILPAQGQNGMGGAIEINGGRLLADTCIFSNNIARGGIARIVQHEYPNWDIFDRYRGGHALGGAVGAVGGVVEIRESVFRNNASFGADNATAYFDDRILAAMGGSGIGGALFSSNSVVRIGGSSFSENRSSGASSYPERRPTGGEEVNSWGGGIYIDGGAAEILSTDFVSNEVGGIPSDLHEGNGGAIAFGRNEIWQQEVFPVATLSSCRFEGNTATGDDWTYGGAVFAWRPLTVNRCIFLGNSAAGIPGFGGAMAFIDGEIKNSVFAMNITLGKNVYVGGGAVQFSESRWGRGSALLIMTRTGRGPPSINHSTFFQNHSRKGTLPAPADWPIGASVQCEQESTVSLAANLFVPGEGPAVQATLTDLGFNISADASASFTHPTSANNLDPQLEHRPNSYGLYFPRPTSPAINRVTTSLEPLDIRGAQRPATASDSGAIELEGAPQLQLQTTANTLLLTTPFRDPLQILTSADLLTWEPLAPTTPTPTGQQLQLPLTTTRFFLARTD